MKKDEKENKKIMKSEDIEDSKTSTRLLNKNWSPLIVRKYQAMGWPLFIGLICDVNLNDLDNVINKSIKIAKENDLVTNDIQSLRDFCGFLSDELVEHYNNKKEGSVEGVAVLAYWDKIFCSSLYGDFMVHYSCKMELYSIINTLPHI